MIWIGILTGFIIGWFLGVWIESNVWRAKAKGPMRHHSGGRLYQVTYADAKERGDK